MSTPRTLDEALEEINFLKRELGLMRVEQRISTFKNQWALTRKEAEVLDILFDRAGKTASRQLLMDALYEGRDEPEIKILDVWVAKIRRKMGHPLIGTTWSMGYYLTPEGMAACAGALDAPPPPRPASVRHGRQEVMAA